MTDDDKRDDLCFKITCKTAKTRLATIIEYADRILNEFDRDQGQSFDMEIGTKIGAAYDALDGVLKTLYFRRETGRSRAGGKKS